MTFHGLFCRGIAAACLVSLSFNSHAAAQGGPPMIGFGLGKSSSNPPPPIEEAPMQRPLTAPEFAAARQRARQLPARGGISEKQIEDTLAKLVGAAAGTVTGNALSIWAPGTPLRLVVSRTFGRDAGGDYASAVFEELFRGWWKDRDQRDRLARVMAKARVTPEQIASSSDMAYRGKEGFLEFWQDMLVVTEQHYVLESLRGGGSSVPDPWLSQQIDMTKAARRALLEARGVVVEEPLEPEAARGKAALDAWRERARTP